MLGAGVAVVRGGDVLLVRRDDNGHRDVPDGNVVDWETHVFAVVFTGGEARAGDDASEVRWWPLNALPDGVSEVTQSYFAALRTVAG